MNPGFCFCFLGQGSSFKEIFALSLSSLSLSWKSDVINIKDWGIMGKRSPIFSTADLV